MHSALGSFLHPLPSRLPWQPVMVAAHLPNVHPTIRTTVRMGVTAMRCANAYVSRNPELQQKGHQRTVALFYAQAFNGHIVCTLAVHRGAPSSSANQSEAKTRRAAMKIPNTPQAAYRCVITLGLSVCSMGVARCWQLSLRLERHRYNTSTRIANSAAAHV